MGRDSQHLFLDPKQTVMRAIRSVKPNSKSFPNFLLFCGTPECLCGVSSSCGGTCNCDHNYNACRSVILMNNVISCLKGMNTVQLVDEQDKCPAYSQNARQCVKDCRGKHKRWSCQPWTEDEAVIAAEMINLLSDYCVKVRVPVILIEVGGVRKMCLPSVIS